MTLFEIHWSEPDKAVRVETHRGNLFKQCATFSEAMVLCSNAGMSPEAWDKFCDWAYHSSRRIMCFTMERRRHYWRDISDTSNYEDF